MAVPTYADLVFARSMHERIHELVQRSDRVRATRLRRWYHQWLAEHHFHEVWERAEIPIPQLGEVNDPMPTVPGSYQLVGLHCTAGETWGGA